MSILNRARRPTPLLFGLSALALAIAMQTATTNYDEAKVGAYTLPDPLILNNGKPVRTAGDWTKHRREEILEAFETNVYGRSPRAPKSIDYEVFDTDQNAVESRAVRKQISIYFSPKKDGPKEDLLLYIPHAARRPMPVVLALNFSGNQAVVDDAGIRLATIWDPKTHEKRQASEQSRGSDKGFDVRKVLARGYAFATICYQDIEHDF